MSGNKHEEVQRLAAAATTAAAAQQHHRRAVGALDVDVRVLFEPALTE